MKFVDIVNLNIRKSDTLGRLGGDEFAIILPNNTHLDAELVANKILKNINIEHEFENTKLRIHSSIGISSIENNFNVTAAELIKSADNASYTSKRLGGNQIHLNVL
jgi:diguanylate cyclase (GGDEF)-like protein